MKINAGEVLKAHDPTKGFGGGELPVGKYLAKLSRVEDKGEGSKYRLEQGFQIIDGDYTGRWTWVKFFWDGSDEKLKNFSTNVYVTYGIDLRDYPGVDVTDLVSQFIYGPSNPQAPTFVVSVSKGAVNPKTGENYINTNASFHDGREIVSPKKGDAPVIPAVPTSNGANPAPVVPVTHQQQPDPRIPRPVSPIAASPLLAD